jgi:hypothetical protein
MRGISRRCWGGLIARIRGVRGADARNPQSWNGYGYVLGNPLNGVDPSGLDRIDCGGGVTADACVTDSAPDPINVWDYPGLFGGLLDGGLLFSVTHTEKVAVPTVSTRPGGSVVKDYNRNLSCGKTANQVMGAVEGSFSRFGNFATRGPLGVPESVTFKPPSGALHAGSSIRVAVQVGGIYTLNTSVTVQYATSQSLGFATVPGHLLYPANIAFSASPVSSSAINFDVSLSGNFPSAVNRFLFNMGGGSFEDAQWNHFIGQVGSFCLGGG